MNDKQLLRLAEILENLKFRTEHGDECSLDYESARAIDGWAKGIRLSLEASDAGESK